MNPEKSDIEQSFHTVRCIPAPPPAKSMASPAKSMRTNLNVCLAVARVIMLRLGLGSCYSHRQPSVPPVLLLGIHQRIPEDRTIVRRLHCVYSWIVPHQLCMYVGCILFAYLRYCKLTTCAALSAVAMNLKRTLKESKIWLKIKIPTNRLCGCPTLHRIVNRKQTNSAYIWRSSPYAQSKGQAVDCRTDVVIEM